VDKLIPIELKGRSGKEVCVEGIMTLLEAAQHDWIVHANFDVIPYRAGNENWLRDLDHEIRKDSNLVGATGSFRTMFIEPRKDKYFETRSFSANFTYISKSYWKRCIDSFLALASINEPECKNLQILEKNRFIIEYAVESQLFGSGKRLLFREEDIDWTVFHINKWEEELAPIRSAYLKRRKIEPHLNLGSRAKLMPWQTPKHKLYYGWPKPNLVMRIKQRLSSATQINPTKKSIP